MTTNMALNLSDMGGLPQNLGILLPKLEMVLARVEADQASCCVQLWLVGKLSIAEQNHVLSASD